MEKAAATSFVETTWESSIVPELIDYIRIPNKSPAYDPKWAEHGHMDAAVELIERWCRAQPIDDLHIEVVRLPDRTPLIYMETAPRSASEDCVLLYGHLDKQPEMVGWDEGKGPWIPVREGDRLYGRGGADDGYAAFASLTAIRALREQKIEHARCVVLIEASEESGSPDLPAYVDHLADRIGEPSLVVCLDSGAADYDRLWTTTSLRGVVSGDLRVEVLREGVHSGAASGIVASSFRILRSVLSRLEDERTGEILPKELKVEIPKDRIEQACILGAAMGDQVKDYFPFVDGMTPVSDDPAELLLNSTWRTTVSITGMDGIPATADAGNVLRPFTTAKVSIRIPPTLDPVKAGEAVKRVLEADPPYGAKVTFDFEEAAPGWNAPAMAPWLFESVQNASQAHFGADALFMGMGGTIPFMGMLGEKFPEAQFLITGVLGPASNAHGPNEFLEIAYAKRLTSAVAQVIEDHHRARG